LDDKTKDDAMEGHVARTERMEMHADFLMRKPKIKRPLGKHRHTSEDVKMHIKGTG
jgi:hypothetical protein